MTLLSAMLTDLYHSHENHLSSSKTWNKKTEL